MPSTSKTQQRLMGVAYAVKKGNMQLSDVDVDYRDKVKDLVDGMTLKQLKDFAETKHEGLPEVAENVTPSNISGMGPIKLPTSTTTGSGDVPAGQGDAEEEYKKKRKKMKHLKNFESFVNESLNESHFKVGDRVECINSGMTGEVIELDKQDGAEDEKYYTVKREDGKEVKYSPAELRLVESKANEEYIELPSLDVPATELIDAFGQWYHETKVNWNQFKEDMAEDSVDEAARNAQMEILAHLSNEMNAIIKDRKFKVRMDLK